MGGYGVVGPHVYGGYGVHPYGAYGYRGGYGYHGGYGAGVRTTARRRSVRTAAFIAAAAPSTGAKRTRLAPLRRVRRQIVWDIL